MLSFAVLALSLFSHFQEPTGLTPITLDRAQALFAEVSQNPEIPFSYPDGCYAKAQKISMLLDEEGVVSAKLFVEGHIFHRDLKWGEQFWLFHVATAVQVDGPDGPSFYLLDPYLAPRLLSVEEWLKLLQKDRRTQLKKVYFASRFVYEPAQVEVNPQSYEERFVYDMELVFRQMRKRLLR